MLRLALETNKGPIAIIGITEENVRRMRAGMPMDINLKEVIPPGTKCNRVVIHLADTYEHVVDDMEKDGIPVNDVLRQMAKKLDTGISGERRGS